MKKKHQETVSGPFLFQNALKCLFLDVFKFK